MQVQRGKPIRGVSGLDLLGTDRAVLKGRKARD